MVMGVLQKPTDGGGSVWWFSTGWIPVDQMFTEEGGNNQMWRAQRPFCYLPWRAVFAVGGLCCIFTLFSKIFSTVISTKLH